MATACAATSRPPAGLLWKLKPVCVPARGLPGFPQALRAGGRSCGGSGASAHPDAVWLSSHWVLIPPLPPSCSSWTPRCPSGILQATADTGVTCPPRCLQTQIPIACHCSQPCLVASSCPLPAPSCLLWPQTGAVLPSASCRGSSLRFLVWAELLSPAPCILVCVPCLTLQPE